VNNNIVPRGGSNYVECPHRNCAGHGNLKLDFATLAKARVWGLTTGVYGTCGHYIAVTLCPSMSNDGHDRAETAARVWRSMN
jgi:hypothetical protein